MNPFPLPVPLEQRTSPLDFIPDLPDTLGHGAKMWRVMSGLKITQGRLAGKTLGEVAPPWQEKAVRTLYGSTDEAGIRTFDEWFLYISKKNGKAQCVNTPLLTSQGWKTMGTVNPGDYVYGLDGKLTRVLHRTPPMIDHECFRVTFSEGGSVIADADHLWMTSTNASRRRAKWHEKNPGHPGNADPWSVITTKEVSETLEVSSNPGDWNHQVPLSPVLDCADAELLRDRPDKPTRANTVKIVSCEPVPSVPVCCISVAADDGMFLVGEGLIPTHNSTFTGMLVVAHALAFPEDRGLCIVLASTKEQAGIVYDSMASTVEADPFLMSLFLVRRYKSDILHKATNTVLKAVACELSSTVGQIPSLYVVDEVHLIGLVQKGAALIRQLSSGAAVRPNPMGIYLTTAPVGKSAGIFNSTYNRAKRILSGKAPNDRMMPTVFELPDIEGFNVEDPKYWWMSNPSLGVTFTQNWLEREFEIAKGDPDPSALMNFYSQHLNIHAEDKFGVNFWIPGEVWDSFGDISVSLANIIALSDVLYASVDLGYRDDPSAIVVMGERSLGENGKLYTVWCQQYLSRAGYEKRKSQVAYDDYIASGELIVSEQENADQVGMTKLIFELADSSRLAAVGVDPMGLVEFAAALEARKIPVIGIKQGYQLNPSLISFERKLYSGEMLHDGRPMLRWNVANGQLTERGQAMALTKPQELQHSAQKIDGLVCMVMCVALADDPEIKPRPVDVLAMIG